MRNLLRLGISQFCTKIMRIFSINNSMIDFLCKRNNLCRQMGITSDPDLGLIDCQVLPANRLKVVTLLLHLIG